MHDPIFLAYLAIPLFWKNTDSTKATIPKKLMSITLFVQSSFSIWDYGRLLYTFNSDKLIMVSEPLRFKTPDLIFKLSLHDITINILDAIADIFLGI